MIIERKKIVFIVKSVHICDDLMSTFDNIEKLFDTQEKAEQWCEQYWKQYNQLPTFNDFRIDIMEVE